MRMDTLRKGIKQELGYPAVDIEIPDESINDAIDGAIQKLSFHIPGMRTVSLGVLSGPKRFLIAHPGLQSVTYVSFTRNTRIGDVAFIDNPFRTSLVSLLASDPMLTLGEYAAELSYIEDSRRVLSSHPDWHAQRETIDITDPNDPSRTVQRTGLVLYLDIPRYHASGYRVSYTFAYSYEPTDNEVNGVPAIPTQYEWWIADYAAASCRQTLGRVLSKHRGIPTAEGSEMEMDGPDLISQGREEAAALEDKLLEMVPQYDFHIG